MPSLKPTARLKKAEKIRIAAAKADKHIATQKDNGDEALYPEKWGSYSKGLAHDAKGDVKIRSYNSMLRALKTGNETDFDKISLGGTVPLVDPQAGLAFTLEGGDPQSFELPAAPPLASAWRAGEAVEAYWMALLRDVPFSEYDSHPLAQAAIADIGKLSDFRGPKEAGTVTAKTLFRGFTPGDLIGPYVSQFLLKPFNYGALNIDQTFRTYSPELDYMTDFADWLAVQNGQAMDPLTAPTRPFGENSVGPARYLRDGRGLSAYVHADISFEPYLNACLMLLTQQQPTPYSEGNPYSANVTQAGFSPFGSAYATTQISTVAALALKAVWFQKWFVHRVLRPEAYGALVHKTMLPASRRLHKVYPVHSDILNSDAAQQVLAKHGGSLLPQAFPEGSPCHPSYGQGHGVIAGACATILKAVFDENAVIADPKIPSTEFGESGVDMLTDYTGPDRELLTVGGEANKLAANIALGRGHAGVNFRSDYEQSLILGEEVAISMLRDQKATFNESASWKFTRFDGTPMTI
jgi:hypothetical protein